jgi:CheY-like chemotaxis protein
LEQVNSHLQITVSDTGKGLDAKFLPHIFERFRQADQTSTRSYGGLGLGLSIVQQIVQLHGGTIHAESAGVGQGASFIVQLPRTSSRPVEEHVERRRRTVENHAPKDAADPDCASPLAHSSLAQVRVLVVEDEADTQHLLRALLEGSGSQVAVASSVAEALELFKQWQPEVLISDIGMPNEDGYALIRKVRAWEAQQGAARVPAIALTAYARAKTVFALCVLAFKYMSQSPSNRTN